MFRLRLGRAFTQRIYLLDVHGDATTRGDFHFKVMGNSGEPYEVVVDEEISCTLQLRLDLKHNFFVRYMS